MNVDNFLRCVKMPLVFSRVAQAPFCQLFFEKYLYSNNCVHLFDLFSFYCKIYDDIRVKAERRQESVQHPYPGDFDPGFAGYAAFTILKFFRIEVLYQICAKQF